MQFNQQLLEQWIIPIGLWGGENGLSMSDPRSYTDPKTLDWMKDLCWRDEIDSIMDYYWIPKNRVIAIHGKTGRYISNRDNKDLFLNYDILPVHVPLVEAHFHKLWSPFVWGYLFAKKQYDDARTYQAVIERPEWSKVDPITWKFIDDKWNVVTERPKNFNPYGMIDSLNWHANQIPTPWQSWGTWEQDKLPDESSVTPETVWWNVTWQVQWTQQEDGFISWEVLNIGWEEIWPADMA